jgi:D-alanyl-D-alanine carboxypeptidase (penicillin-binding protein 5/6)
VVVQQSIRRGPGYLERVTVDDAPAPTRRARRAATGEFPVAGYGGGTNDGAMTLGAADAAAGASSGSVAAPETRAAADTTTLTLEPAPSAAADVPAGGHRLALTWVDEDSVARNSAPLDLNAASSSYIPVDTDLLARRPRRPLLRSGVVIPTLAIAGVLGAYAATTLAWPLHAVAPTVTAVGIQPAAAPATAPAWPAAGSAAIAVQGIPGTAASADAPDSIASITKLVTALVVLDQMPLAVGEQGPQFRFGWADSSAYWDYLARGESAIDVPVDGSLSEYQMLQGMLVGSANNYADRLAGNLFPSDEVFADAAMSWLSAHGVPGVTIVEPTGMDPGNSATPAALITLAQRAMAHPVIAEIVAQRSVELPGAGLIENTNALLADPGVVGIKTGTLAASNLLSAKDVAIGDTTVRLYASVLGQPDDETRLAATRALYAQLEQELQLKPSVTAGTLAGSVETAWGEDVAVVTADDASVVLWNGGVGEPSVEYALRDHRDEGDVVGALTVAGPLDTVTVDLLLAEDIEGPDAWWRLTHPLELFGLTD